LPSARAEERFGGLKPFEFHFAPDEMKDEIKVEPKWGPALQKNQDIDPPQKESFDLMFVKAVQPEPKVEKDPDVWDPPSPRF
jgi:hypothetical protein